MTDMPDAIIKTVTLRASLDRVWRAISDSTEFGQWFGVRFDGPFIAGQTLHGRMVPTVVNDEIAAMQKPYEGMPFDMVVVDIAPMTLFSFRWHPYGEGADLSDEPMTLVSFALEEVEDGVHLTITESGFSALPPPRHREAFTANEGGWEAQSGMIAAWLAR